MQIDIQGPHVTLSAAINAHIEKKCRRLEKHHRNLDLVRVILKADGDMFNTELLTRIPKHSLVANGKHENMYTSIDQAVHSLDEQLRRYKEKNKTQQP